MTNLTRELDALVPPFDDSDADWDDALRRRGGRSKWPLVVAVAALVAGALAATSFGIAVGGTALDRLTAWVSGAPGEPAPERERRAIAEANARSLAPIPADTELGLLVTRTVGGVTFELLGFRDRGSLCLRVRSSAGNRATLQKAPADCVYERLLIDLGKPLAVVAAANPFPKHHLVALYGFAADRASAVELRSRRGVHRVPVENNAFLSIYEGESPRLSESRLDYRTDVPLRATALDAAGRALGSVRIMSLRRGYPAPPAARELPGPVSVEHDLGSPRVGWLERGEARGEQFEWRLPDGTTNSVLPQMRVFHPSPATSLRVLVSRSMVGLSGASEPTYCLTHVWALSPRPTGAMCGPTTRFGALMLATAWAIAYDAQFPIHYGLVADGVESLKLYLANGKAEAVPIVDNVFVLQASSAEAAKLVAYDERRRVVAIRVVSV